eukprot:scaffold5081_cov430-Prasinococcus_capsulatus_cf.AAC.10
MENYEEKSVDQHLIIDGNFCFELVNEDFHFCQYCWTWPGHHDLRVEACGWRGAVMCRLSKLSEGLCQMWTTGTLFVEARRADHGILSVLKHVSQRSCNHLWTDRRIRPEVNGHALPIDVSSRRHRHQRTKSLDTYTTLSYWWRPQISGSKK